MKKIIKFIVLVFVVVGISACGKVGKLERVKSEQVIVPELDILPHNSK
jgi:predicted small lipoprotein YifL